MFLNLSPSAPPNNGGTVFDMCPPGGMMCDGVCLGVGAPTAENPDPFKCPDVEKVISTNTGISPMLILAAAAAAFFFAG